jgi:hypothetical protein
MFLVPCHLAHASRRGQMESSRLSRHERRNARSCVWPPPPRLFALGGSFDRLSAPRNRSNISTSNSSEPRTRYASYCDHWWAREDSNLQPDRYERPRSHRKAQLESTFFVAFERVRSHPFTGFLWSICGPFAISLRRPVTASSMAEPVRVARSQGRGRKRGPLPHPSCLRTRSRPWDSRRPPPRSAAAVNVAPGPQHTPGPPNMHARGRRSQRSSNRLDPSDGCCCRKEHRKKVRLIRPRQSQAEQGDQRNYSELPYVGVQSLLSPLPQAQVSLELNEPRGAKCGTTSCRRRAASTLSQRSISRRKIKVTADEVRSFLPYLGQTRNDAPSAL